MKFDLPEFLDSLKGLTRSASIPVIQEKLDELDKYNRIPKPTGKASIGVRLYTQESEFLNNLLYEVKTGGRSEVKKIDREEIDEVLKNLKLDARIKVVKKSAQ